MVRFLFLIALCIVATPLNAANFNETRANLPELRETRLTDIAYKFQHRNLEFGNPLFIRIFKGEKQLELWVRDKDKPTFSLFKTYAICHYSGVLGPKLQEGDHQAPEGFYSVTGEWMNPNSKYYLSFNIGYPNVFDKAHERTGHSLMVHGGCSSEGCFSMRNRIMAEIYLIMEQHFKTNGADYAVPVHIFPFRMMPKNIDKAIKYYPQWMPFWMNLKQGYDIFEKSRIPPGVSVYNQKYVFHSVTQ